MKPLLGELTEVFRVVFGADDIVLLESTTAADVDGWDSLTHLNLIIALEKRFAIRFSTAEIAQLKENGQNVGKLVQLIHAKQGGQE